MYGLTRVCSYILLYLVRGLASHRIGRGGEALSGYPLRRGGRLVLRNKERVRKFGPLPGTSG